MLGLKARWILLGATVAASGLTLQPASAVDIADVKKVCEEFLLEHLGDSDKEKACIAAMEQHAAENPPPDVSDEELAPVVNRVVPENQIQSASRPDSTDRDKIAGILRTGASADVLVEFEVRDVDIAAFSRAFDAGVDSLRAEDLAYKREEYARVKASAMGNLRGVSVKRDYDNLPTAFVQIADEQALNDLMSRPDVRTVHENKERQLHLAQSLPIIGQPAAAAAGRGGAGTTVAVLDSGVTYSRAEFNSCTSPGVPAACRVKATLEATATNDGALDDDPVKHGTNVSAIIAALAGDANLVVADVISVNGLGQRVALDADVATGLN